VVFATGRVCQADNPAAENTAGGRPSIRCVTLHILAVFSRKRENAALTAILRNSSFHGCVSLATSLFPAAFRTAFHLTGETGVAGPKLYRGAAVCILGCAIVSPFSCGTSQPPAESRKPSAGGGGSHASSASKNRQQRPPKDPLIPPIDVGDVHRTSADGLQQSDFAEFEFSSGDRATFEPHGKQVCASGCAVSRHPTKKLTKAKYHWLLRRFAEQPLDETSPALESLMYFGRQTLLWMERDGTGKLDAARVELLKTQLKYTYAVVRFRIVDEHGVVRVSIPPTRVPLDRRHVFNMDTKDLPPLITSGTVKRVGLHHLWTRL
jgi:hypothetical protein